MEPVLATPEEMDEIIDMRAPRPGDKPVMRVTPEDLRGSGVLQHLPEFIAQLARAKVSESQSTAGAEEPADPAADGASGFELDEEQAREQVHVEMDIVAGILEEKGSEAPKVRDGSEGDDSDKDFEMAIPCAGTTPATAAGPAGSSRAPLIRTLSSSSGSSDMYSASSPPKVERKYIVEDLSLSTPPSASNTRRARSIVGGQNDKSPLSSAKKQRARIHTNGPLTPSRERSAGGGLESETSSSGTSSSGSGEEDDDDDIYEGNDRESETVPVPAPSSSPVDSRKRSRSSSSGRRARSSSWRPETKRIRPLIEELE